MNEITALLKQWQLDEHEVRERMYRAPSPRERERWHAVWLLVRGWSDARTADALERDPSLDPRLAQSSSKLRSIPLARPSSKARAMSQSRALDSHPGRWSTIPPP